MAKQIETTRQSPVMSGFIAYAMAALPYVSVLIGMYIARSAWLAMGLYHALAVVALILVRPRVDWRLLGRGWHRGILVSLAIFCAMGGVVLYGLFPFAGKPGLDLGDALAGLGLAPRSVGFFAYYCLLTPPIEELLWRGQLGRPGRRVTPFDALFAGYHLLVLQPFLRPFWLLVVFVSLISASWLWRWTRWRTGGLGIALVTHFVADVAVMWAIFALAW